MGCGTHEFRSQVSAVLSLPRKGWPGRPLASTSHRLTRNRRPETERPPPACAGAIENATGLRVDEIPATPERLQVWLETDHRIEGRSDES